MSAAKNLGAALAVMAIALFVYAPARGYDFVAYDDARYVLAAAPGEPGLTWGNLRRFAREPVAGLWHPLTMASHLLDAEWFGLKPAGHHLHSLLLHGLNAALLFLVGVRLTGARGPALALALLWAVHPVAADSAVWIAERKNLLSTFWWLAALGLYAGHVRRPSRGRRAAVLGAFGLALLAKPMAVTLPFTLLVLDFWPLRRVAGFGRGTGAAWRRLAAEKIPFFLLAAVFAAVTWRTQAQSGATEMGAPLPGAARLAWTPIYYLDYLRLFAWPAKLSVLYPRPAGAPSLLAAGLAAAGLLAGTGVILARARRWPWVAAGWIWFLGTLVPVIGWVPIGLHRIADRYLYVPMIGLLVAVVWTGQALARGRARPVLAGLAAAAVVALAVAARMQLPRWRNSETLFRSALAHTQDNFFMHYNLGRQLVRQGRFDEAIAHLQEARRIHPDHALACNNLGCALVMKGEPQQALPYLEESVRLLPAAATRINLARALLELGRFDDAAEQYRRVLQELPGDADARRGLRMAEQRTFPSRSATPVSRVPSPAGFLDDRP